MLIEDRLSGESALPAEGISPCSFEDEWCSLDKAIKEIRYGGDNVKDGVFGCISPISFCNLFELSGLFIVWAWPRRVGVRTELRYHFLVFFTFPH